MKIQIISDLHLEFGEINIDFSNSDLVVLAGDINIGIKGIEWIKKTIPDKPVIYVLGNHEYYKGSYPKTLHKISSIAAGSNIHILENSTFEIDGWLFHGATLWTDFSMFGDPKSYGAYCQEKMNDYKLIRRDPSYSKLRSIDTYAIHQNSRKWLIQSLQVSAKKKNIVITHHVPSQQSIPLSFQYDILSSAYASNLEALIFEYQPAYWIHGHIHTPCSYNIGATKIICNPLGYQDEPFNGHSTSLIIDLE